LCSWICILNGASVTKINEGHRNTEFGQVANWNPTWPRVRCQCCELAVPGFCPPLPFPPFFSLVGRAVGRGSEHIAEWAVRGSGSGRV
jgi:hypothetical protein